MRPFVDLRSTCSTSIPLNPHIVMWDIKGRLQKGNFYICYRRIPNGNVIDYINIIFYNSSYLND